MKKSIYFLAGAMGVIALMVMAAPAGATLTMGATTVTSDGALTVTGAANSTWDLGAAHTLSLQTDNNGPITTGTGLTTLGGSLKVAGTASSTSIILLNGATITNATPGVVQILGTASTTGITLLNGATIDNATNGMVTFNPNSTTGSPGFTFNVTSGVSNRYPVTFNVTNTVANKVQGFYVNVNQTTTANTDTIEGALIQAVNNLDANVPYVTGLEVKAKGYQTTGAVSTKITNTLRGIYTSVDAKDQNVGNQRGLEISLDGGMGNSNSGTADMLQGIYIANNRSAGTTQTEAYGIYLAGGSKGFTADLRLQNGNTINNPAAGTVAINALVAASGYQVTNGTTITATGALSQATMGAASYWAVDSSAGPNSAVAVTLGSAGQAFAAGDVGRKLVFGHTAGTGAVTVIANNTITVNTFAAAGAAVDAVGDYIECHVLTTSLVTCASYASN